MANHHHTEGHGVVHHNLADALTWPLVVPLSIATWPVMPWFSWLWTHAPTPTAVYMGVSLVFMLFQMCDKMGWLERMKRRPKGDLPVPDDAPEKD